MSGTIDSSYVLNTLQIGVPFAAYFVGIIVRKNALPGANSPALLPQLLLGVPMSLVIVSPILTVFAGEIANLSACLLTVGLIMEQGMLVTETATKHLKDMLSKGQSVAPLPAPQEQG
jgi:hypothetical protein